MLCDLISRFIGLRDLSLGLEEGFERPNPTPIQFLSSSSLKDLTHLHVEGPLSDEEPSSITPIPVAFTLQDFSYNDEYLWNDSSLRCFNKLFYSVASTLVSLSLARELERLGREPSANDLLALRLCTNLKSLSLICTQEAFIRIIRVIPSPLTFISWDFECDDIDAFSESLDFESMRELKEFEFQTGSRRDWMMYPETLDLLTLLESRGISVVFGLDEARRSCAVDREVGTTP